MVSNLTELPCIASRRVYRIVVVDSHPIVRRGLSHVLVNEPDLEICGEAEDSAAALQLVQTMNPDVVVLDITLKNGSGLDAIKQIKAASPDTKILVLSLHSEVLYAEQVLRTGAKGFISKQESPEQIVAALRAILNGQIYLSRKMSDRMLRRIASGGEALERSPLECLSDRELEVFGQIGQGMTTRQIAERLHLSPKTIETHRENIKKKLSLVSSVELTHRAVRWVLEEN